MARSLGKKAGDSRRARDFRTDVCEKNVRGIYEFFEQDSRLATLARIVLSLLCVLIMWQVASKFIANRLLLVPPIDVGRALVAEARRGAMWTNAGSYRGRGRDIVCRFSGAGNIPIGLALASSRFLSMTMGPVLSALNSVPIIALAPLFIAGLGLGFASKFVLVLIVAIFPVIVTTETGLRASDKQLIEAARSFNATSTQIFTTVTFPFALPFIVSGIRVAWARALVGIVVAEFFGSFAGFGFAILSASQTFDTARVLALCHLCSAS